jgi:hypothetical protein
VKAADQFHVGIVVDDLHAALTQLGELFGYEWCGMFDGPVPVTLPTGPIEIPLKFVYSRTAPRVEVIQSIPGTLWVPASGSGIHHLGYWSDDVARDAAALQRRGFAAEATGTRPDGTAVWAYHRSPTGPRIELVDRQLQSGMEQMWATTLSE